MRIYNRKLNRNKCEPTYDLLTRFRRYIYVVYLKFLKGIFAHCFRNNEVLIIKSCTSTTQVVLFIFQYKKKKKTRN